MALHPIPMPGTGIDRKHRTEKVSPGDLIVVYFDNEVSYTYTQTPPAPVALTPQLPSGTFYSGDFIGPFIVGDYPGTEIKIEYIDGGSDKKVTIKIN